MMLWRSVSLNRYVSCATSAMRLRRSSSLKLFRSAPSIRTVPVSGSQKRRNRAATVLLPAPDGPTSATDAPRGTAKETFDNARLLRPG